MENNLRRTPISIKENLKLFEVHEYINNNPKELIFYSNPTNSIEKNPESRREPYSSELIDKKLSITLTVSKGKTPSKPFIRTITAIEQTKQE